MKKYLQSVIPLKIVYRKVILLIGIIFGFNASIVAQYGAPMAHYKITGKVIAKDCDVPIPNIKLNISSNNYQSLYGPLTDQNGNFELWFYRDYGDTDDMKMLIEAKDMDGDANGGEFLTFEKTELIKLSNARKNRNKNNDETTDIIIEMDYKGKPPCKKEEPIDSVLKKELPIRQMPVDSMPKQEPPLQKLCVLTDSTSVLPDGSDSLRNSGRNNPLDIPYNDLIVVYPNPSKGIYTIKFRTPNAAVISIYVYDSNSKLILTEAWGNCDGIIEKQLNLEGKAPGTYYLILKAGDASYKKKLIKQ